MKQKNPVAGIGEADVPAPGRARSLRPAGRSDPRLDGAAPARDHQHQDGRHRHGGEGPVPERGAAPGHPRTPPESGEQADCCGAPGNPTAVPQHRGVGQLGRQSHHDEAADGGNHPRPRRPLHRRHLPQPGQAVRAHEHARGHDGRRRRRQRHHLPQAGRLGDVHHQA